YWYARPHARGRALVGGPGAVKAQRLRGLDVDDHLGQLAPHQRLVDERPAECPPLPGVAQRLDQGAARVTQPEQRDTEASGVGQLHHAAESLAVGRARGGARFARQQKGFGVDELDLARGHRAGAELVLQTPDPYTVTRTVAPRAEHEEIGDAAGRVGSALGFGQYDERLPGTVG